MSERLVIRRKQKPTRNARRTRTIQAAFERPAAGGATTLSFPGLPDRASERNRRTLVTGSISAGLHFGLFGVLMLFAGLAPVIEEAIIPVQLIKEPPKPPPEPAAAPKALAERRSLDYAPQVQAIAPQIVNPQIIAEASPAVSAEALQMDSVSSVAAPTQINRSNTVVERVSAVNSPIRARAAAVDVAKVGVPVVRGPTRIDAPVGPSVGPRRVETAKVAHSYGTGRVEIGGSGSSVREGVVSSRDVLGSPEGARVMSVDTQIGEGLLRGTGGDGTGVSVVSQKACIERPEVQTYLSSVRDRTISRWVLPPGLTSDQKVTLRFRLDVAGSATSVSVVRASDNSLGASALDALRAASPFPPMPDDARCLSQVPIVATFSNPVAG